MTSKPTKKQQRLTPTQARAARRSRKQSRGKFIRYGGAIVIVAIALLLILSLILPGLPIGTELLTLSFVMPKELLPSIFVDPPKSLIKNSGNPSLAFVLTGLSVNPYP